MKGNNRHFCRFITSVVKWLCTLLGGIGHFPLVEGLLLKIFRILETRGRKECIRFCKETRFKLFELISKIRRSDEETLWIKLSSGLPKPVKFLKYYWTKDFYPLLRLVLSVLYVSRSLTLPVSINYESITGAPICGYPPDIDKYAKDFWLGLGYRSHQSVPRRLHWKKFHLSTKSGPNGQAMWASIRDLVSLPDSLRESIGALGGNKLASRMELLLKFSPLLVQFFGVEGNRFRKVSAIQDIEGKTREVAILDYWSQTALRPLHHYLFDALRKIRQDCTFDQGSFKDKLPKEGTFYSVDLTTATDRFPIQLIADVLKAQLPEQYVKHWRNVMVGYPFETPTGSINYSVGNPMGAYSSWNSFALAHHYVVYYCCRKLGRNWVYAPYVLLGDDIVIADKVLAEEYMRILTSLGVEFSVKKTHISDHSFEFAKRFIWDGLEVTPFPVSALWSCRKSSVMMLNVLDSELRKGWVIPNGIPVSMSELFGFLGLPRRVISKRVEFLETVYQLMIAMSGRIDAQSALKPIVEKFYPNLIAPLDKAEGERGNVYSSILKGVVMQAFTLSAEDDKKGKPLGQIAVEMVILLTSVDLDTTEPSDLISSVPILNIHGQIEEHYLKIKREAWDIDTIYGGDWKLALRALTIPLSDQVYFSRNQDLRAQASSVLSKILLSSLRQLAVYPQLI